MATKKPTPLAEKPCVKCGAVDRYKDGGCRPCTLATNTAWRNANRERKRKINAAWKAANVEHVRATSSALNAARYAADPERMRAKTAAWQAANPERHRVRLAAWRAANKEHMRVAGLAWYAANKDKVRAKNRAYHSARPEIGAAAQSRRRARRNGATGDHTAKQRKALIESYCGLCAYCLAAKATTVDHIVPLVRGGSNSVENLVPTCKPCNSSKRATPLLVWLARRIG